MSMETVAAESEKKVDTYTILRYDFPDKDTLEVCLMDGSRMAAAIRSKELQGTVETKKEAGLLGLISGGTKIVTVTDSPENLARFLKKHGRDCFDQTPFLVLKKQG